MTTLSKIFKKAVDRPIEGVIKADDQASLKLEIEEYVLTNEVEKRLESFFDAYNNYAGANGVWISGFFGSGKSHLLKILALLLENRKLENGVTVSEIFLPKCSEDNEILKAEIKSAVAIPSKSILFNIDQKADVISKTQLDALIAVFVKVFDESCGYYGKQPYIAQFERELDRDGLLNTFKNEFKSLSSEDWEWGRQRAKRVSEQVDKAYNIATGQNVSNILDKYRADYRLSIEDFAEQVNSYIESQGKDFRLNFFVDEVGQYIADNVKLMVNLQTVAESLATKCRGRAWIIVTAQDDMTKIVGEGSSTKEGDNFSRIQARFKNRMKLTSADVAEVIQKRLLTKDQTGINLLSNIYHSQADNFKTLFDFADGSQSYKNFKDKHHFIDCYPFIPYQFGLFQSAIQNLSEHNAFEGKHSSVGERSMLGVFQQVAIHVSNNELGQLATFDMMFEGIRNSLKANSQSAILSAERELGNEFAIRVLKALFLVKYIKGFKSTIRNICVLMYQQFEQDLPKLRKIVEESLNILEQQTYIQRNGEIYEYLTDEEKVIEQEIKNIEVDSTDVAEDLAKIVFDNVIRCRNKIRFDENGQDYTFTRKLDDRLLSRESELAIHVISPFHENTGKEVIFQSQSMGRDELFVLMPADHRLRQDLTLYKQTEKYIKQNISITQQDAVKRILTDKGYQNSERFSEIQQRVASLIANSKMFINGSALEINGDCPQSRITRGFYELISRSYPNLRMLRSNNYTENSIAKYLDTSQEGLFGNDVVMLSEAEQELIAFIQSNNRGGIRTTLKNLIEKFERKPYGWYYAAILCIAAKLLARGKLELRIDGNILEENEIEKALRNTHGHGNVILEPQIDFTASQVRNLKEFYEDFFEDVPPSNEAKILGAKTGEALKEKINELSPYIHQINQYPFLAALNPVIQKLKEYVGKPYTWYLVEFLSNEEELLDLKETVIDPIKKFMDSAQKEIYDSSKKYIQTQEPNFAYVSGNESTQIKSMLDDFSCYKGNLMQQVKSLLECLKEKVNTQLETERSQAKDTVEMLRSRLISMDEFSALHADKKDIIFKSFDSCINTIEHQSLIAVISDTVRRFEESEYQQIVSKIINLSQSQIITNNNSADEISDDSNSNVITETKVEYITAKSIRVQYDKAWLADESDVNNYVNSMREALLTEINSGKRIQI